MNRGRVADGRQAGRQIGTQAASRQAKQHQHRALANRGAGRETGEAPGGGRRSFVCVAALRCAAPGSVYRCGLDKTPLGKGIGAEASQAGGGRALSPSAAAP